MPKVSVIIPVYGVEKYIEQCVRSLFAQTLDDVEYIFINDCTPDRSIELLQSVLVEYPQRKEQVYIFHNEKNIGQVGTRKRGVSVAKGDYVIHCDSDDWVEENWLEILYKKAILTHAEIVWCDFTSCHEDGKRVYIANEASPTIEDFFFKLIIGIKWGTLWSHLVKREIVQSQQIVWPTWNYCEDLALVFQYITLISNVAYIKESLYNYRYNLESISGKRDKVNVLKNIQGEINASLVGIACSKKMGLSKRFAPYFCTRILKAKGRIFGIAKNDWETCKLWNSFNDGITICDVWTSSLLLREKISLSFVRLYIYPLKKNNMSQRIGYLDVAKFIGLALVCFCHIPMPTGNFHAWIYSFHMPLFFLLSGIFFNPDKFSLKKVSIQLLLPFVLFNFLAIVINICLNFIIDRTLEFPRFNLMNGLMGEYVIGPSWFLLSLFTIRIFCSYMYKYAKMFGLLIGIILLLLVFLYTRETNIWNVLNIGSTVLGLPFYLMGFISKDIMIGNINCGGWIVTILLTLISCLAMCNGLVGIHAHLYGDNLFAFFLFLVG